MIRYFFLNATESFHVKNKNSSTKRPNPFIKEFDGLTLKSDNETVLLHNWFYEYDPKIEVKKRNTQTQETPKRIDWCHGKPTLYGVKFINFKCLEIEQNYTSL